MEIEILARAAVEVLVLGMLLQRLGQVFEVACVRRPKIPAGDPERIGLELQSDIHHLAQALDGKLGDKCGGVFLVTSPSCSSTWRASRTVAWLGTGRFGQVAFDQA